MQLSLSETAYQKSFFCLITDQSLAYYKLKLRDFNRRGQIDSNVTNSLFTLINTEIKTIKELYPSLTRAYTSHQLDCKAKLKNLLTSPNSHNIITRFSSDPFVVEYKYYSSIKHSRNEYDFLLNKFNSSLEKLFTLAGLYEELYLVNSLLVANTSASLTFKDDLFIFKKNNKSFSFKIFPLYFIVKDILSKIDSDFVKQLIMEFLFAQLKTDSHIYLTISDDEQVKLFSELLSLTYLSDLALPKLLNMGTVLTPKISNLQHLRR